VCWSPLLLMCSMLMKAPCMDLLLVPLGSSCLPAIHIQNTIILRSGSATSSPPLKTRPLDIFGDVRSRVVPHRCCWDPHCSLSLCHFDCARRYGFLPETICTGFQHYGISLSPAGQTWRLGLLAKPTLLDRTEMSLYYPRDDMTIEPKNIYGLKGPACFASAYM
jgi:hypothetical protein